MSAYINGKEHIDYLLTAASKVTGLAAPDVMWSALGQQLIDENIKSVWFLYNDDSIETLPGPVDKRSILNYQFTRLDVPIRPLEALKAVSGYMYQSCEHPEWETSKARQFCEQLIVALELQLEPGDLETVTTYGWPEKKYRASGAYDNAPTWEVTPEVLEELREPVTQ